MSSRPPRGLSAAALAAVALVFVAAVVQPDAGVSVLVVRISELLLAGGAAYLLDDAAVVLTTVTPVGVWRRRLPRLLSGVAVVAGAWALILVALSWQDSLPPGWVTSELVVLCLVALGAAAVLVAHGEAEPGGLVAPVVGLVGIGAVIADLLVRAAIFVPWDGSGGQGVRLAWVTVGVLAVLVIAVGSRDPGRSGALRSATARRRSGESPSDVRSP
jgi:hypothetical protein